MKVKQLAVYRDHRMVDEGTMGIFRLGKEARKYGIFLKPSYRQDERT